MAESLAGLVQKLLNGEIKPAMTLEEMEAWEMEANREIAKMREKRRMENEWFDSLQKGEEEKRENG